MKGGKTVNDETVVENSKLGDGTLKSVTGRRGEDDGGDALFRFTYLIGASRFSIKKEVGPEGAAEFFAPQKRAVLTRRRTLAE